VSGIEHNSIVKIGTTKWRLKTPVLLSQGIRAIEYHRHDRPDAHYRRLPMPWITLVITLGVVGEWRDPGGTWQPFPRLTIRGHGGRWTEGRDDPVGESEYLTAIIDPLAFRAISGVSAAAIAGRFIAVADVPRLNQRFRLEQLRDCSTPAAKMLAVAAALTTGDQARLEASTPCFARTALGRGVSVGRVASEIGCSERRLLQEFGDAFGLSPKAWQRLDRFASSLKVLHPQFASPDFGRADAFFDQSHFIHDFRYFSGTTPGHYARQKARGDARLFLAD
jgi:AraC-like DNA-binding protein